MLHHSQGESYGAYRRSAFKYEHQQRLFLELQGNKKMFSLQPEGVSELNVSNPEASEGTPNMDGNIAGLMMGRVPMVLVPRLDVVVAGKGIMMVLSVPLTWVRSVVSNVMSLGM